MTMTQQREQSSRHIGANNMGSALVSEAKMVQEKGGGIKQRGMQNVRTRVGEYVS